jgi:hypothetical protein
MSIRILSLKALGASGVLAACGLAACSSGGQATGPPAQVTTAEQILATPKGLSSVAEPQPNGTMWVLAGNQESKALFELSLSSQSTSLGFRPVSNATRSVAESLTGVIGLALGSDTTGALQLMNGSTGTVSRVVPLGAPARQVVVGSDGNTFYVLNGTTASASVTIIDSQNGRVLENVPVPLDTVSVVPDVQETTVYALQRSGLVTQIAVAGGTIETSFGTGGGGRFLTLSPDGSTLYVLKGARTAPNVAVVDIATQSVRKVLPAPANCLQILLSANGSQLYQMVGTPDYGNIQVFAS